MTPTYPTGDDWADQPDLMTAAARTAWQDRLLRGLTDGMENEIAERIQNQEQQLAEIYRPLVASIGNRIAGQEALQNAVDNRIDSILQQRINNNAAQLAILQRNLPKDWGQQLPQQQSDLVDQPIAVQRPPNALIELSSGGITPELMDRLERMGGIPENPDGAEQPQQIMEPAIQQPPPPPPPPPPLFIPPDILPPPQPTFCGPDQVIEKLRPDLNGEIRLPYWECNGKWYVSATMPCGVPVPPGVGWMRAPFGDGSAVYRYDTEAEAYNVCQPQTPKEPPKDFCRIGDPNCGDKGRCPPPPPPEEKCLKVDDQPPPISRSQLIDWNNSDVCAAVNRYISEQATSTTDPQIEDEVVAPGWLYSLISQFTGQGAQATAQIMSSAAQLLSTYREPHPSSVGCSLLGSISSNINHIGIGFLNGISRGALNPIQRSNDYILNYGCPNELPSQAGLDMLLQTGNMEQDIWTCLTRALGHTPNWHLDIVKASYTKPDVFQTIMSWRRDEIKTKEELRKRLVKLGVKDERHQDEFIKLTESLPGISDIIRLLVRDAADENLAAAFKLDGIDDSHFSKKWTGDLIKYAKAQGISDELAKYFWRAHWEVPARTHLNEFLHRLRVMPNGAARDPSGVSVSTDDVKKVYVQNDMAPIWVDKYMATSYNVIGRIDLRRIYGIGVFGKANGKAGFRRINEREFESIQPAEKELHERYQDMGYNKQDASVLAYYTAADYDRSKQAKGALKWKRIICESYSLGVMPFGEAKQNLIALGETDESATNFLDLCFAEHGLKLLKTYVASVKKLYMIGDIDNGDVVRLLTGRGIGADKVQEMLGIWEIERASKAKFETPQLLCQAYNLGVTTAMQMLMRLRRLNYDEEAANRIVNTCVAGKLQRDAKEQRRQQQLLANEQRRAAQQRAREMQRLQREIESDTQTSLTLRSEKNLANWWKQGIIDEGFIRVTFRMKGYRPDDTEKWINANRPQVSV